MQRLVLIFNVGHPPTSSHVVEFGPTNSPKRQHNRWTFKTTICRCPNSENSRIPRHKRSSNRFGRLPCQHFRNSSMCYAYEMCLKPCSKAPGPRNQLSTCPRKLDAIRDFRFEYLSQFSLAFDRNTWPKRPTTKPEETASSAEDPTSSPNIRIR